MVEMDIGGSGTMVYPDIVLYAVLIFMFALFSFIGYKAYKMVQDQKKVEAAKLAKLEKKRTGSGKGSRKDK